MPPSPRSTGRRWGLQARHDRAGRCHHGAPIALRQGSHVAIEIFPNALPERAKQLVYTLWNKQYEERSDRARIAGRKS